MYSLLIILLGIAPAFLLFASSRSAGIGPPPLKVMGWTVVLGYTLKSFYLSAAVVYDLPFRPDWLAFDIVHLGQFAVTIAILCLIAGYAFASERLKESTFMVRPPGRPMISPKLYYYPILAISFGLLVAFFVKMGFVEQIMSLRFFSKKFFIDEFGNRNSLGMLSIGGDFILVFFVYYFALTKKFSFFSVYSLMLYFLIITHILGSKRNAVLMIVILMIIVLSTKGIHKSIFKKLGRIAVVCGLLIIITFASQIRSSGQDGNSLGQLNIGKAVGITLIHAFEGAYFMDPAKTAVIVDRVGDDVDYLYGSSIAGLFIAPVPRLIWPEKPIVRAGPFVAQELMNFQSTAGVPPGVVGELYLNFGWFGILIGMPLIGMLMAYLWHLHKRSDNRDLSIIRYAFYMISFVYLFTVEFTAASIIAIKFIIAMRLIEPYWRQQLRKQSRSTTFRPRTPANAILQPGE